MDTFYTLPSDQTIVLAVIGFIGILSTGLIVSTAFRRNKAHKY